MKLEKSPYSMTIGTLAKASGVGVETVRFYERKEILRRPSTITGIRYYSDEDAQRIIFIKKAQALGFTLKEIKELLGLQADSKTTCADLKIHTETKLIEVEAKIKDLKTIQKALKRLSKACGEGEEALRSCRVANCFGPDCKC